MLETFRVVAETKAGLLARGDPALRDQRCFSVEDVLAVVRLARLGGVTVEGGGTRSRADACAAV